MLSYNSKQRAILFIASMVSASFFFAFLIMSGQAQQEVTGTSLLKEYFLPIQALGPIEAGAITINGNECATAGSGDCVGHDVDATLGYGADIDSALGYKKSTDGLMLEKDGVVTYKVTIIDPNTYQLRLTARNAVDSLDGITRSQYDVTSSIPAYGVIPSYATLDETEKELSFRKLRFEASIIKDGDVTGTLPRVLSVTDRNEFNSDSIDLGALQPGSYTVTVEFINDLPGGIDYLGLGNLCSGKVCSDDLTDSCLIDANCTVSGATCIDAPTCSNSSICSKNFNDISVCALPGADNFDGSLEKTPIIKELKISKTTFTNDVMGVRVYSNPEHLSALDWYYQKLNNPGNAVPTAVDGYRGVLDGRTAYINAANVDDNAVFYTNIYVIAYNINASPATVQIYNQVLSNWQFNVNLSTGLNELEKDRVKNQLRRDTMRLEDVNMIRATLDAYKLRNNKYPDLKAGTFVSGHALSTWPTWQLILGTQLSTSLPVDPINQLAIASYPKGSSIASEPRQYDCTSEAEKNFCQTVCTSTEGTNQPLTGCRADHQCVDNKYCSLIPPGYDPVTGWNQTTQKLAFTDEAVTGLPNAVGFPIKFGMYSEGSFNTNGAVSDAGGPAFSKYKDDAFVYQYTAVNGGESYIFNYRLEYSAYCGNRDESGKCTEFTAAICANNQCYFEGNDTCLESGEALYDRLKPIVAYKASEATGNKPAIASQENFSIAMVVKSSALPAVDSSVILAGSVSNPLLSLRTISSGSSFIFTPNSNILTSVSTPVEYKVLNDVNYHVVGVYSKIGDNFLARLYVNGLEVDQATGTGAAPTYAVNPLTLAAGFSGAIKSFAIYNKVLTVREIQDLYSTNDSFIFDKYRNTYCFAGLFVNSCGNGIVQLDAGEQCEPSVAGTNSNYCDATYGQHAWYNKGSVNPGCTTSCETVTNASVGQLPVPYNAQQPALSCGGYCGDNLVQFENREQCDQGSAGGAIKQPNRGGSGGIGPDSQYVCTPAVLGRCSLAPLVGCSTTADCTANDPDAGTCVFTSSVSFTYGSNPAQSQPPALTINAGNLSPVKTVSNLAVMPANTTFTVAYTIGASQSSDTNVIDVLLEELSGNNTLILAHRKSFAINSTGDKSLTFTTRSNTAQARLTFSFSSDDDVTATVSGVNVNSVNGCISFGGFCGDGSVQSLYNEQCDILSYRTPSPAQSVNQFIDPSFEQGLGLWKAVDENQLPVSAGTAGRGVMSIEGTNKDNIKTGSGALIIQPSTAYIGVGQEVFFAGSPTDSNNTIKVSAWVKRIVSGGDSPVLKVRAYQYNPESGSLVNFTSGPYLEKDLLTDLQDPASTSISGTYELFTNTDIIIPKATTANTNTVTFVAIVATGIGAQDVLFIDDINLSSNYRIQYSCGKVGNQSCQMIGGFCGDSAVQKLNGESCDNGTLNGINGATISGGQINGVPVTTTATTYDIKVGTAGDGVADGFIQSGKAYSYCTSQCSQPFCGDGIKGVNGITLATELCDPSDPLDPQNEFCTNSCSQLKLGGTCTEDIQCVSGTVCATNVKGDKKCVLLPGQRSCFEDIDCLIGLECNPLRHMCMVPLDKYLKYHGDPAGFPRNFANGNPIVCGNTESDNACTSKGLKCDTTAHVCYDPAKPPTFTCPYTSIVSRLDIPVVLDGCTGLEFRNLDLPINTKVSQAQAADTCMTAGLGFTLPAAKELFALVSSRPYLDAVGDGSSSMAPNNYLKLCSVNGLVTSKGGDDSCIEGNSLENYLYWTDTRFEGKKACSITNTTSCIQDSDCPFRIKDAKITTEHEDCSLDLYYAVNFKKGSLEVYPENTLMRSRCVSTSSCGNGSIEADEQCDFNPQGVEQISGATCQEKGFAGGNVHCDPVSCRLRYDNCLALTKPASTVGGTNGVSCQQACNLIGEKEFPIYQCTATPAGVPKQGCTDVENNSECVGTCQSGSCSNNPGVSCSVNANCNFGSCAVVPVTAKGDTGLITVTANQEEFPSQKKDEFGIEYDVALNSSAVTKTDDVTVPRSSICIPNVAGGVNSAAGANNLANAGICDLSIFGPANTAQIVANTATPAALCTCVIPNPTYYSNNSISITNETTKGILALDALDNFKNAFGIINTLQTKIVSSWSDDDFTNYMTAQSFVSSLDANYPANILSLTAPNANVALQTKITLALSTNVPVIPVTTTAQILQNSLNTMTNSLVTLASSGANSLTFAEASGLKKFVNSIVDSVKRLFGRSVEAAISTETEINNASAKLERAETIVDLLPPVKLPLAKDINRSTLITEYKALSATWPSLNNETELLSFKYHLYSLLTEADVKIKRVRLVSEIPADGLVGVTQEDIEELSDKGQSLRDSVTNAVSTSTYYIESTTVRDAILALIDTNLATIRNYVVTIDCPAPKTADKTFVWNSTTASTKEDMYRVQYNGTETEDNKYIGQVWKINGTGASIPQITSFNETPAAFKCLYKCAVGYHEFDNGMCIVNACQGVFPTSKNQATNVPGTAVTLGAQTISAGAEKSWNDLTSYAGDNIASEDLSACQWSCPSTSFKDPSTNICLSECTNLCTDIKLSDTLIAQVITSGGDFIDSDCATDEQIVGCGIGSGNSVHTDFTCPAGKIKTPTGCVVPCDKLCSVLKQQVNAFQPYLDAYSPPVQTECATRANIACDALFVKNPKSGYFYPNSITPLRIHFDQDSAIAGCSIYGKSNVYNFHQMTALLAGVSTWNTQTTQWDNTLSASNVNPINLSLTCLDECTNICSNIKLPDALVASVTAAGGTLITSECTDDKDVALCGIGSGNSVPIDYTCPASMTKVASGCQACPFGQVRSAADPSICIVPCANLCSSLTSINTSYVTTESGPATFVQTQCTTGPSNSTCDSSKVTSHTCPAGLTAIIGGSNTARCALHITNPYVKIEAPSWSSQPDQNLPANSDYYSAKQVCFEHRFDLTDRTLDNLVSFTPNTNTTSETAMVDLNTFNRFDRWYSSEADLTYPPPDLYSIKDLYCE